jgi:hypothetical protein
VHLLLNMSLAGHNFHKLIDVTLYVVVLSINVMTAVYRSPSVIEFYCAYMRATVCMISFQRSCNIGVPEYFCPENILTTPSDVLHIELNVVLTVLRVRCVNPFYRTSLSHTRNV